MTTLLEMRHRGRLGHTRYLVHAFLLFKLYSYVVMVTLTVATIGVDAGQVYPLTMFICLSQGVPAAATCGHTVPRHTTLRQLILLTVYRYGVPLYHDIVAPPLLTSGASAMSCRAAVEKDCAGG